MTQNPNEPTSDDPSPVESDDAAAQDYGSSGSDPYSQPSGSDPYAQQVSGSQPSAPDAGGYSQPSGSDPYAQQVPGSQPSAPDAGGYGQQYGQPSAPDPGAYGGAPQQPYPQQGYDPAAYGQQPPQGGYDQPPGGFDPNAGQYGAQQQYGQPPAYPPAPGYPAQQFTPAPGQQPVSPSDERLWATIGHISIPFFGFIGPLITFLIFKDRSAFLKDQSTEALNFSILYSIATILSSILVSVIIGLILWPIVFIGALILCIMAAMAANKGTAYRYPFNWRIVK